MSDRLWPLSVAALVAVNLGSAATLWAVASEAPPPPVTALAVRGARLDTAPAPKPEAETLRPAERAGDDGPLELDFADLDFPEYVPADLRRAEEDADIPADIAELDGLEVTLSGFMIATTYRDRVLEEFILARFPPGCCFGAFPVYFEWASVTVPDELEVDDESPYTVVTVTGVLEVGERLDADGYVESLYRLSCESVDVE